MYLLQSYPYQTELVMNKSKEMVCLRMNNFQKNKQNVASMHTSKEDVSIQNNIHPWIYGTTYKKIMTCDVCGYTCESKNTFYMHKQNKHKKAKEQEDSGNLIKYELPQHVNLALLSESLQKELIGLFQNNEQENSNVKKVQGLNELKREIDIDTEALLLEEDDIETSGDENETLKEVEKVKLEFDENMGCKVKFGKFAYRYNKNKAVQELTSAKKDQNTNIEEKNNLDAKVEEEEDFEFSDEDDDVGKESSLRNNIERHEAVVVKYDTNCARNGFNNRKAPGTNISKILNESLAIIDNVDKLLKENTKLSLYTETEEKFVPFGQPENKKCYDMISKSNYKNYMMGGTINQQSPCFRSNEINYTSTTLNKTETGSKLSELKELDRKQVIKTIKKDLKMKIQTENKLRTILNEKKIREMKTKENNEEEKKIQLKTFASQVKAGDSRSNVNVVADLRKKVHLPITQRLSTAKTIPPSIVHADYETFDEYILDEMINEMIHKNESLYTCTVCGKATSGKSLGKRQNLRDHVEARHVVGVVHHCQICGAEAKTRNSQRMHMQIYHKKNHKESSLC